MLIEKKYKMNNEIKNEFKFEAYLYRTSLRFGSRVTICINSGSVSITGPRIGPGIYKAWGQDESY